MTSYSSSGALRRLISPLSAVAEASGRAALTRSTPVESRPSGCLRQSASAAPAARCSPLRSGAIRCDELYDVMPSLRGDLRPTCRAASPHSPAVAGSLVRRSALAWDSDHHSGGGRAQGRQIELVPGTAVYHEAMSRQIRRGWRLGAEDFLDRLKDRMSGVAADRHEPEQVRGGEWVRLARSWKRSGKNQIQ